MRLPIPAIVLGCLPGMALAEPFSFGDFTFSPEFGIDVTSSRSGTTETATTGYLGLTLAWERQVGALTFGAELFSEIAYDSAEDPRLFIVDPVLDPGLWVEGDRFGYLALSYTSSAIGEHCIEAPSTGENFGQGDYVTVGTCPAFDTKSVLYYRTADLGSGVKLAVSYMPETGIEDVEAGEVSESASAALVLEHETRGGATLIGSFGFERALSVEDGGPLPTAWQAGLNWEQNGWTLGGAAAITYNGDGTRDRGFAVGVSREVTDALTVSVGANRSESRAAGAQLDETTVALIGLYTIVPEKVLLDAGLWRVVSDDGGTRENRTVAGIGLSVTF